MGLPCFIMLFIYLFTCLLSVPRATRLALNESSVEHGLIQPCFPSSWSRAGHSV